MIHRPSWLHPIQLPMPATMGSINAYLILGPEGAALVDTGLADLSSRTALEAGLQSRGLGLRDIQTVVCSHHHIDHAGLGKTFRELGARVLMSEPEAALFQDFYHHPELDGERAAFFGRHELPRELIEHVTHILPFLRKLCEPFDPETTLVDSSSVSLGGIRFQVLITPGHTPGHVCLYHPEAGVALTGDCVMTPKTTHISPRPELDDDADHFRAFITSLRRLQALGAVLGCPGHGRARSDLSRQTARIQSYLSGELAQVADSLGDRPRSAFSLTPRKVDARERIFPRWLAVTQTVIYLTHLVRRGEAEIVEERGKLTYRALGAS